MKQRTTFLIFVGVLVIILGGLTGYLLSVQQRTSSINNYEQCVAAGYPIMESHPPKCSVPGGKMFTQQTDARATYTGTVVCLPHKNADGPQTLECATGLKTDKGKYYALHGDDASHTLSAAAGSDKKVRITGDLVRGHDGVYQVEGTIHFNDFNFL